LKLAKSVVVQIVSPVSLEGRQLNEDGLHRLIIRKLRIDARCGRSDTGRYDLKPAATKTLEGLAALVQSYSGFPVLIDGHTDNVGKPELNRRVAIRRQKPLVQPSRGRRR
jgi:hypothetical protein